MRRLQVLLVLLVLAAPACSVAGQVLRSSSSPGLTDRYYAAVRGWAAEAPAWRAAYAAAPGDACQPGSGLCAAAPGTTDYARLVVATSPLEYDARSPGAGSVVVAFGSNEAEAACPGASVARAVAVVAEAAAASALQLNRTASPGGGNISLSVHDLAFCGSSSSGGAANQSTPQQRSCSDAWDMRAALERLVNGSAVVAADCLPFNATGAVAVSSCSYRCRDPPAPLAGGTWRVAPVRSPYEAQQQVRRSGAFVTRFEVPPGFADFWARRGEPGAVLSCAAAANGTISNSTNGSSAASAPEPSQAQAVAVIGYNLTGSYWLVQSSSGAFRVAFGGCGMLAAGDTFGLTFVPSRPAPALQVAGPTPPDASNSTRTCYTYTARSGDYVSRVADAAGIRVNQLLLDNNATLRDVTQPLAGASLLLCDPSPAAIAVGDGASVTGASTAAAAAGAGAGGASAAAAPAAFAVPAANGAQPAAANASAVNATGPALPTAAPTAAAVAPLPAASISNASAPRAESGVPPRASVPAAVPGGAVSTSAAGGGGAAVGPLVVGAQPAAALLPPTTNSAAAPRAVSSSAGVVAGPAVPSLSAAAALPPGKAEEVAALLALKEQLGLKAPQWQAGGDPCNAGAARGATWPSVYCNPDGHVYVLDLSSKRLTGSLSDAIDLTRLPHLQTLWLFDNPGLTGSLPASWSAAASLRELSIYGCSLTGPLPAAWGSLKRLQQLFLHNNKLSGPLPEAWGSMAMLKNLGLAQNEFVGSVPASWSGMRSLRTISLHDNDDLSGCLPPEWGSKATGGTGLVRLVKPDDAAGSSGKPLPGTAGTKLTGNCKPAASAASATSPAPGAALSPFAGLMPGLVIPSAGGVTAPAAGGQLPGQAAAPQVAAPAGGGAGAGAVAPSLPAPGLPGPAAGVALPAPVARASPPVATAPPVIMPSPTAMPAAGAGVSSPPPVAAAAVAPGVAPVVASPSPSPSPTVPSPPPPPVPSPPPPPVPVPVPVPIPAQPSPSPPPPSPSPSPSPSPPAAPVVAPPAITAAGAAAAAAAAAGSPIGSKPIPVDPAITVVKDMRKPNLQRRLARALLAAPRRQRA